MSSPLKLANNAFGRLASNRSTGDTTLVLQSGDGAKFPALAAGEYFPATLVRSWDGAIEIVKVTARSTDSLTVQRAQESTAALAFLAGDRVELRLTAGTLAGEVARVEANAQTGIDQVNEAAVKRTGDQTIAGVKTFSSLPVVPLASAADVSGNAASTLFVKRRFGAVDTSGTLDWNHVSNTIPGTAPTLLLGNAANGPGESGEYFHVLNFEYASKDGTGNLTQYAIPYFSSVNMYMRTRYSGTWTAWQRFANNTNITSMLGMTGQVSYFARNTAPDGWLKANGAAVSRTTYAELFAAIGTTFGAGNGSTTFNLPDLRGEFIRGWDDGRGADSGRSFGTPQGHALQSHTHDVDSATVHGSTGLYNNRFAQAQAGSGSFTRGSIGSQTVNTSATTAAETRPRNIALLACIKF